ncbi:Uncharacterised protein [Segatella copri]|nr:Uncharacterised protein [Segatella copri]
MAEVSIRAVDFCTPAMAFNRTIISATDVVIYRLPFIPFHQEKEPLGFCNFFSFST